MPGFVAFRCCNFDNTAEREQFRFLCKELVRKYADSEELCLLIANYNIFDSEFDSILIKNDAIIAIEFKNYGGIITATENGDWTSDGKAIKGGSRKTVYQQARVNHAAIRNGLKELGVNSNWLKDLPAVVVFNEPIELSNQLSGRVKSWLHITDNHHFVEKISDITCRHTDMSNDDILSLAGKLNLSNFIDVELSAYKNPSPASEKTDAEEVGARTLEPEIDVESSFMAELTKYDRFTPIHVFALRENQIFVFGTDQRGSQRYGAAGIAFNKFGAKRGVIEGKTGSSYALPTKGFPFQHFANAVSRLIETMKTDTAHTYLVTPVGCGHAGYDVKAVANLFKEAFVFPNVMLPKSFIEVYISSGSSITTTSDKEDAQTSKDDSQIAMLQAHGLIDVKAPYSLIENGDTIATAECGSSSNRIVFNPINKQSLIVFKNAGYSVSTVEAYLKMN